MVFNGEILLPDGRVALVPYSSSNIGLYDPVSNEYTNGPTHSKGGEAFLGGVLLPNGKVIFVPRNSLRIGVLELNGLD